MIMLFMCVTTAGMGPGRATSLDAHKADAANFGEGWIADFGASIR